MAVATITREEQKAKIENGDDFVPIEALDEKYYRHTHLPGAVNLPPKPLKELAEFAPDKTRR